MQHPETMDVIYTSNPDGGLVTINVSDYDPKLHKTITTIEVNGDGLQPHLEKAMTEVLETVAIKVKKRGRPRQNPESS